MKRVIVSIILSLVLSFCSSLAFAQAHYCWDAYDKYRQIRYWAVAHVSVDDFKYDSGDAKYLKLTYKDGDSSILDRTSQPIITHFRKEFDRLIKGKLPFHDDDTGYKARMSDFYKKRGSKENFMEKWQASEEARRKALYGTNPGALYCLIKISRREFPVLYEIKSNIVASNDLANYKGLEVSDIGYSTPEHIEDELKRAITEQLESLKGKIDVIRKCPKKSR